METKEKHTAQGYQVSPQTALFLDALRGLDEAYSKVYSAIEEYSGSSSVDRNMEEHFEPLFNPMRKEVESWMLACITNTMGMSESQGVRITI